MSGSPAPTSPSATPGRDAIRHLADPLAQRMADAGLSANHVTLIGFAICVVGALLAAVEWWLLAGIIATAGSAFDMFDGAVARVTGTTSKLGAFLDSTFDRWGEAMVYLGIIIGASNAGVDWDVWLATAAMGAAFMVSYVRARAESLGFAPGKGMAAVGLAPREVRVVILAIGLIGAGLLGGVAPGSTGANVLGGALLVIAVLATITVIQRILFTIKQAASEVDRP